MHSKNKEAQILRGIDSKELVELAVKMGNIYSPTGQEEEMAAFVYKKNWGQA